MNKKVIIIGIASTVLVVGGLIWYYKVKNESIEPEGDKEPEGNSGSGSSSNTNTGSGSNTTVKPKVEKASTDELEKVKTNIGAAGILKDDKVAVPYLNNKKNSAVFFNNNRFSIYTKGNELKTLVKGSYSNGGLTLSPDGGSKVTSNSVLTNLEKLIASKK
jgi:hypothetical protein